MTSPAPLVRMIEGRASWRNRAFNTFLRTLAGKPLLPNADLGAMRKRYEALDAQHAPVDRRARREAVDCLGVAAEWVSLPESRPERVLLCLHGGSFAFRFPNTHAAFAARLCSRLGASRGWPPTPLRRLSFSPSPPPLFRLCLCDAHSHHRPTLVSF